MHAPGRVWRSVSRGMPCALVAAALLALGCASSGSGARGIWVKSDGAEATPEEVKREKTGCARRLNAGPAARHDRFRHHAWARDMLTCMEERGFKLVEDTSEP